MELNHETHYGLYPVPRDITTLLPHGKSVRNLPQPILVNDIPFPETPFARKVLKYAETHLSKPTLHHSLRAYYLGQSIVSQQFPEWSSKFSHDTFLATCLLHDLGTTEANIASTPMSFEFYGAILAREWLLSKPDGPDNEGGGPEIPRHQADSITEAIIRHQDLECVKKGNITVIGQLLQLATLLDNAGKYGEMVHTGTIDDIIARYPRLGWRDCFCRVIEKETELKPWCHTSKLGRDEFVAMVKGNELMERYEDTLIV